MILDNSFSLYNSSKSRYFSSRKCFPNRCIQAQKPCICSFLKLIKSGIIGFKLLSTPYCLFPTLTKRLFPQTRFTREQNSKPTSPWVQPTDLHLGQNESSQLPNLLNLVLTSPTFAKYHHSPTIPMGKKTAYETHPASDS